eukprot:scaffold117020_cov22-Prasinocladus_malaysianus.AAC.1
MKTGCCVLRIRRLSFEFGHSVAAAGLLDLCLVCSLLVPTCPMQYSYSYRDRAALIHRQSTVSLSNVPYEYPG